MATKTNSLTQQALKLSVEERVELIGLLWDSMAPEALPGPTQAQRDELDRRHAEYEKDPSIAIPIAETVENVRREVARRTSRRKASA